jgi:hypothetical protein
MSVYSCLREIVGFTRETDSCVSGYDPSYSDSDSGLFIDELPGMGLRILNSTGGHYDIWEKMTNASENAINAFKIEVLKEILKTKEPARPKFKGDIGEKSYTTTLSSDTYHGLRLYSDINGGSFTLRGITLLLNVSGAITLTIWRGEDEEEGATALYTYNLTSVADRPKYNAITPIELTLDGNYYFLYTTTGLPLNNKLGCNCGGYKWCFDPDAPCYRRSRNKWTEWVMAAGVHGSDLTERDDWPTSRDARGIALHGDFGCDTLASLCDDHADWDDDPIDSAIAWAILYKAGSFLSTYIMDSEEINRYTLLGIDQLGANIAFYEAKFKEMIEFIGENFEGERNECLKCRDPHGYKRMTQML